MDNIRFGAEFQSPVIVPNLDDRPPAISGCTRLIRHIRGAEGGQTVGSDLSLFVVCPFSGFLLDVTAWT